MLGVTVSTSLRLMSGFPEFLASAGWQVHIVSAPGPELGTLGKHPNIHVHQVAMLRDPSPLADARALYRWTVLLRRIRPDVVMVGTPKAGLLGLVSAFITGVPVRIYHVRGLRLETAGPALRVVLAICERVAFALATSALSVSRSLRDRVIELGLVGSEKIVVLGRGSSNGVDLLHFRPATDAQTARDLKSQLGIDGAASVIGFVGRISRDKGIDVLVEASNLLDQAGVDHTVLIVGQREHAGEDPLAPLRTSGQLPVLVGPVLDPARFYQVMDVLCLPTLREGFPNVILEAGASGVPAVTTTATGAVDAVMDGVTGVLVPPKNPEALASALRSLLDDRESLHRLGDSARRFVEAYFDRALVWNAIERYLLAFGDSGPRKSGRSSRRWGVRT